MKKLLIGFALTGLIFSCKSTADVADTSMEMEATCAEGSECCATECSGEKMSECSGEAAEECSGEAKVCPVTGAVE